MNHDCNTFAHNYQPRFIEVFVNFIIIPLNEIDERKYQAQRYNSFSWVQTCSGSAACAAVHVNWKKFPGIIFSGIGDKATV